MNNVKTDVSGKWVAIEDVQEIIKKCVSFGNDFSIEYLKEAQKLYEDNSLTESQLTSYKDMSFGANLVASAIEKHFNI